MSASGVLDVDLIPPKGYLPAQEEARRLVEDPRGPKWVLLSGGQGAGKSYWLVVECLRVHFMNVRYVVANGGSPSEVWSILLSPTNVLLRKGLSIVLEDVLSHFRLEYEWNKSDGILRFAMGGGIYTFTAEHPERIVSVTASAAWYDEPGTPKNMDALRRLPGRLRGPGILRKIGMAGTPEDIITRQDFYDFIASPEAIEKYGSEGDNSRRVVFASTRDNVMIEGLDDYVAEQLAVLTRAQAQAYVEGQFVAFNVGRVYAGFIDRSVDSGGHRIPAKGVDGEPHGLLRLPGKGNELYISLDFNVDPMCGIFAVRHAAPDGSEGIRVLDEIRLPASAREEGETPIGAWCREAIRRWVADWNGPVHVYGDATAERDNVAASRTGWALVHDALRPIVQAKQRDYMIGVWPQNPREIDRVNSVNAAFEHGQIVVADRCIHLRRDLNIVGFKPGTTQIDKTSDPKVTHLSDALGYLWVQLRGIVSGRLAGALPQMSMSQVPAIGELYDWPTG